MNLRHKEIIEIILGYTLENGYQPSYQEIANMLGLKSKGHISTILNEMQHYGYIKKHGNRAIKLSEDCRNRKFF
ncbi:MAG: hypothetical protein RR478_04790 [Bacilli bacterium]